MGLGTPQPWSRQLTCDTFSYCRRCYGLALFYAATYSLVTRRRPFRSRYGCALRIARTRLYNPTAKAHRILQVLCNAHYSSQYTGHRCQLT
ncbi:hypothetical protein MTO96_027540 [Rhipicephalus appendiculatus]